MTTIKDAVDDLFNSECRDAALAVDRHFGPQFQQRINGRWVDRAAFVESVTSLREVVEHAAVIVLDEVTDGLHYAERHIIDLLKIDGDRIRQEVYVFGHLDTDGRFGRIEEVSLTLESD